MLSLNHQVRSYHTHTHTNAPDRKKATKRDDNRKKIGRDIWSGCDIYPVDVTINPHYIDNAIHKLRGAISGCV